MTYKYLKVNFLLLLIFACTLKVQAQTATLVGKVAIANTNQPIGYAAITLGTNRTQTDTAGFFSIKINSGKYTVRVRALGFKSYERRIEILGSQAEITILLEPEINQLDQFVFSGGKIERKAAQEVMTMNIIKPNLIAYTNANDLSDVVNKVPGVSVIEGQVSMRGGVGYSYSVGSRVIILLDDMPLMGGDLGDIRWKLLPIEAAEQIEVVKGATSVLYGSSALNGSINVRTGWAGNKPETKFTTYQGITDNPRRAYAAWWERTTSPFTTGAFFSHKQKMGNFDLVVSANVNMVRSHLQENDEFRARSYLKTRYRSKKIKGLSYGLNGMLLFEKAGRFFLWADGDSNSLKPYAGSAGQDFWRIYTLDPHVTYQSPNNKTTHALKVRSYNIVRFVDQTLNRNLYNANAQQTGLDYTWQRKWPKHITTTSGFYGTYTTAVSNIYSGRYIGYSYAFFSQADYMREKWNVSAGTRYEFNRIDANKENRRPMFKLGANYQVAKKTYLRANYGEGYRFPTIGERYVNDRVAILRVFPNPDLKTEFGWTAEIGVKQGFKIGNWNGQADWALFWQEYTNLIEFKFDQYEKATQELPLGTFGFKALNLQQARVAGTEISVSGNGNIGDVMINVLAGYTYSFPVNLANDTASRNPFTYFGKFIKSFGGVDSAYANDKLLPYRNRYLVKGDIEISYRKLNIGYGVQYYSKFDKMDPLLYVLIPGLTQFMNRIGSGDWVHQARIGMNISPNVTISFLINNLTNLEYATRPARMDAPRTFNLQLRVKI